MNNFVGTHHSAPFTAGCFFDILKIMTQLALYRKYRPTTFDFVLGQEGVVQALLGAIQAGTVAHAYLFSGSRGTGKTSIARIFATQIGCTGTDLYEIDAASNRGIDDVRALREGVQALPFESPYKVYIIDEVHMLTKEAFNALLKILEEPPRHAVFILATTELRKVPDTIISRCQTFLFKRPGQAILQGLVRDIAQKEGYTIDQGGVELIALLGDGSFRDTHGMLQKVFASVSKKSITSSDIEAITGAPPVSYVHQVVGGVAKGDTAQALGVVRAAVKDTADMKLFTRFILRTLRAILLVRFDKSYSANIEEGFSMEEAAFIKEIAADKNARLTGETLSAFISAYERIGSSVIASLPLELAIIELAKQK
ncbi:MAG: DNA polymerase III subunit gamma/tau [Minisyncoccota bacterium]